MNLDKGAERNVDESRVPGNLKSLIPLVKKWAFRSLDDQDAFVKAMKKSRRDEVEEFARAVNAASDDIQVWGESLPFIGKHLSEYTDDDLGHPFHAFISMKKCREAVGWDHRARALEPEVVAMRERLTQERRLDDYKQATRTADEAFRQKHYEKYVQLLSPFEELLTPTQRTKLSVAKSKI